MCQCFLAQAISRVFYSPALSRERYSSSDLLFCDDSQVIPIGARQVIRTKEYLRYRGIERMKNVLFPIISGTGCMSMMVHTAILEAACHGAKGEHSAETRKKMLHRAMSDVATMARRCAYVPRSLPSPSRESPRYFTQYPSWILL